MVRGIGVSTLTLLAASCALQAPSVEPFSEKGGDGSEPSGSEPVSISSELVPAGSCENVAAVLKDKLIQSMEARLEANLLLAMDLAVADTCEDWGEEEEEEEEEEASEYSGTNVQVADVDEADFVKNDGGYLYILADGRFRVLDAWPADQAHALSSFPIEGTPKRMYVHADTAVIYSSLNEWVDNAGYDNGECTYGYDCDFTGDGLKLQITVLDISDRANPVRTRDLVFNGSYLNSRRVDMDVHTAVVFPEFDVPNLNYWPAELPGNQYCWPKGHGFPPREVYSQFDELRLANLTLIEEASVTDLLPSVRDTLYAEDGIHTTEGPLSACEIYVSQTDDAHGFLSLVSFAIAEEAPVAATTILSRPGAVYGSTDSLYVAVRHARDAQGTWFPELEDDVSDATSLHKFALHSGGVASEYAASGVVKGRILNQFAMDEHNGVLRIATTNGHLPSPDVHSTVSMLSEQGAALVELGRIDHLAPTEDIRSARFRGDVGFVVTFKKTDPLFVLDLADPSAPTVEGELKIPGYSTYMHLMDDDNLLTMGYDADDQGSFAWYQGIQLQVIGVSDLANPALLHKEVIGTRGSTSEAATNHLAFTYFKARDLLAVPMTVCEGGDGDQYGDLMTFSGLLVYRVTADGGFTLLGGVPHEEPETPGTWSDKCSSWWTDSASKVQRSVFMEDWVFSIARDQVNVAHIDDLAHPAVSIPLTGE